ncbi:hypothetical protein FKP32DRAFT_1674525 [Trametes sanguinea]|nr:hypothetical protein FKP32DRAFT_1674525 [Trametes sanguinea]
MPAFLVTITPGDLGRREVMTGVVLHPDGRREASTTIQEEIPLPCPVPTATSAAPKAASTSSKGKGLSPLAKAFAPSAAPAQASTSSSAPARSPPRPPEAEVTAHAARRATVREQKTRRAEALKEEGNTLFKKDDWAAAAESYREAAMVAGPLPVYMSNLAAALLKLELWNHAENAATRALIHDSKHIKARFRRAIARKELHTFDTAEADLQRILSLDPANASARSELEEIRRLRQITPGIEGAPELDEIWDGMEFELEDESDSEDFYDGNDVPCNHYNHARCARGTQCRFSHAPDRKSVRDELGRNVCVYWLLGECLFGAERCVYAHDRTYLPERGWWDNKERNARLAKGAKFHQQASRYSLLPKLPAILAEAAKPGDWRDDLWVDGGYAEEARLQKEYGDGWVDDEIEEADGDDDAWVDKDEDEDEGSLEREMEERSMYCGYTQYEFEELLSQGIKPWDEW